MAQVIWADVELVGRRVSDSVASAVSSATWHSALDFVERSAFEIEGAAVSAARSGFSWRNLARGLIYGAEGAVESAFGPEALAFAAVEYAAKKGLDYYRNSQVKVEPFPDYPDVKVEPDRKRPVPDDFDDMVAKRSRLRGKSRFAAAGRRRVRGVKRRRVRRSRYGRGRRYRGKTRRLYAGLPRVTKTHGSGLVTLDAAGKWEMSYLNVVRPGRFAQMFRECRLLSVKIAVRRRRAPATTFVTSPEGAVVASREETNNIYWCPWGIQQTPAVHPRRVASARLVGAQWSIAVVPQRVIRDYEYKEYEGSGDKASLVTKKRQQFGPVPWRIFDGLDASTQAYVHLGYFFCETKSASLDDVVEVQFLASWGLRGRLSLQTADVYNLSESNQEVGEFVSDPMPGTDAAAYEARSDVQRLSEVV